MQILAIICLVGIAIWGIIILIGETITNIEKTKAECFISVNNNCGFKEYEENESEENK